MGLLDKLGGLGKLAELVGNTHQLPAIVAHNLPGATLTLGRMRLYQEIAGRSAIMAMNCNRLLALVLLQKRDVSTEELQSFNAMETELLLLAKQLNHFPISAAEMNLEKLAEAFGLRPGNAGATTPEGDKAPAAIGNGHAGAT